MFSDMTIVINTLDRPNKQITLNNLPENIRTQTVLSVQAHEASRYTNLNCLVLPESIRTLPVTRQWLLDNISTRYLLIMDDDLSFFARKDKVPSRLYKNTMEDTGEMITVLHQKLEQYPMVGVSAREGNNRFADYQAECARSMRIFGLDLHVIKSVGARFDRTKTKEDMDMTLQLLRKGHKNCVLYNWANDHVSSNAPGGCATYRTFEMMEADAETLRELHPEFVTVVKKKTKTSWGGSERTDVRVQWKKAFASSQHE